MRIKQVIDHIKKAQSITFIIGAGASRSAGIPLAGGLVDIINRDYGHCLYDLSDEERQDYGKAMSELSPADRKALIQPLLDNSVLNWGHFALAGVIGTGKVKRVLSFNFDFLLERAAALHGYHLPVYDFGVSPTRDITGLAEPALFHLHGQSYGLRLLNSEEETRQHTDALEPLVADCVRNGLTIVTGYSGEADAAFELIERNYNSNQYLIWLGHAKEPASHLAGLFAKRYATYIGECDFDRVMIEIAQGLNCFPPSILQNPPQHVLEQLKNLPTFPVGSDDDEHVQLMDFTRDRLQQTADGWVRNASADERVTTAFLKGQKLQAPGDPSEETETRKRLRASQLVKEGGVLVEEAYSLSGTAKTDKLREAGEKYAAALVLQPDNFGALNNWGNILAIEAEFLTGKAKLAKINDSCEKYLSAFSIDSNNNYLLNNWAFVLCKKSKEVGGMECEELLLDAENKLRKSQEITGLPHYNLACCLVLQGRLDEALDELEACEASNELPDKAHLQDDPDMDSLREHPRFIALMVRLA